MDELKLPLNELGHKLLKKDSLYNKLSHNQKQEFVDFAIKIGRDEGVRTIKDGLNKNNPTLYISKYCKIAYHDEPPLIPIYSEIEIKNNKINLYLNEIKEIARHFKAEGLVIDRKKLNNIFLLHEFFHYLEYNQLKPVSSMKKVVVFSIFSWKIERGILALSEIAANSYVREIIAEPLSYLSIYK